jgi:altronate dehydratase small subunit
MAEKATAIMMNRKDNVATAIVALKAGTMVALEIQGRIEEAKVLSDIPLGHKFALRDIAKGETVIKYGEPIGQSTARIVQGEHVHVHNVVSQPQGGL